MPGQNKIHQCLGGFGVTKIGLEEFGLALAGTNRVVGFATSAGNNMSSPGQKRVTDSTANVTGTTGDYHHLPFVFAHWPSPLSPATLATSDSRHIV